MAREKSSNTIRGFSVGSQSQTRDDDQSASSRRGQTGIHTVEKEPVLEIVAQIPTRHKAESNTESDRYRGNTQRVPQDGTELCQLQTLGLKTRAIRRQHE
jgi:hypothetical protein